MQPISMAIRGALIAALAALGLAIGVIAEQERIATVALQAGGVDLSTTPAKLRIALALLFVGIAALGYLLFALSRARTGGKDDHVQTVAAMLEAAAPPVPQSADIRPRASILPSTEAGQLMAAGALMRQLSHELNNTLGPIQGFAELLSNDQQVSEQQRRQAAKIAEATTSTLRTIQDFTTVLGWSNDRTAIAHLGALVKTAASAAQSALGRPIPVTVKSESDVQVTATEAQAGQSILHLCAAVAPLLSERDMRVEITVDSVVGAAATSSDDGGAAGRRLEIWSDPFEPERLKIQFGALQSSWRYGRVQFIGTGHGWAGALASRLFAAEAADEHDQTCLSMAVLGGMMLDLGGVIMIDTCPQRHLAVTLLWPARIASEVAAPLEIDTTEDDLDALIIHEAEAAAEALSRRLGGFGLRVASTTSPEAGLDLIVEMGARCRAVLIGETADDALRMKVMAIRPGATILALQLEAAGTASDPDATSSEAWQIDPDREALGRLAARLRRDKTGARPGGGA